MGPMSLIRSFELVTLSSPAFVWESYNEQFTGVLTMVQIDDLNQQLWNSDVMAYCDMVLDSKNKDFKIPTRTG